MEPPWVEVETSLALAREEVPRGRSWNCPNGQTMDERTFACLEQVSVANLEAVVVDCDPPLARVVHVVLPKVGEKVVV